MKYSRDQSALFCGSSTGNYSTLSSDKSRLQVTVKNVSGLLYLWTKDIASRYHQRKSRGPPIKDIGSTIPRPTILLFVFPIDIESIGPLRILHE